MGILSKLFARQQVRSTIEPPALVVVQPSALRPPSQTVVPHVYPFRCLNSAVAAALQERLGNPPFDKSKIEF